MCLLSSQNSFSQQIEEAKDEDDELKEIKVLEDLLALTDKQLGIEDDDKQFCYAYYQGKVTLAH